MLKRYSLLFSLLLSVSSPVFAFDYDVVLTASERIVFIDNFWDDWKRAYKEDDVYNLLLIYPSVDINISRELSAYCELNTAFYWGRETDEHTFEESTNLFECFLNWKPSFIPGISLQAGRIEFISADGYIYDKDSQGILMRYNLSHAFKWPATLKCLWTEIEEESFLFHFQYDHSVGFFERIGLFWADFHDGDNGVGGFLNRQFPIGYYFDSSGNWRYTGVELEKFLGTAFLKASYIYQFGSIDLDVWRWTRKEKKELNISAHLFDVNLSIPLGEDVSIDLFYLFATGEDVTSFRSYDSQDFTAFFSVAPFIEKTSIFFNGGVDDTFTSDNPSLAGVRLAGLSVPGVTIRYHSADKFDLHNTWALLLTQKRQEGRGPQYGWENDFFLNWYLNEYSGIFIEADYLHLGNFFKDAENTDVWKVIVGVAFYLRS